MSQAVGDFSTEREEAPFITIDGERYELAINLDTSSQLRNNDLAQEYQFLIEKSYTDRDEEDFDKVTEIMDKLMSSILRAPPEIIAKLTDNQKGKIVEIWSKELKQRRDPIENESESAPASTDSTVHATG